MPISILVALCAMRPHLVADVAKVRAQVSPYLYGIFFEEINCAGDGGIYAELVRNRSFEEADTPVFWDSEGGTAVVTPRTDGGDENHRCLQWHPQGPSSKLSNAGYWGMAVKKEAAYEFSMDVKGDPSTIYVNLESSTGQPLGGKIVTVKDKWNHVTGRIVSEADDPKAKLVLRASGAGTVLLDNVSLFPQTFKNRSNGLRPDLAKMLQGMKPAFMRFPGGCWVEGERMATAMRWKKTLGPVYNRRTQPNLWQYVSGNGLGFHEYLQMCEDIGAAPLFVINCGMSHQEVVPIDQMGEYVQDALDAIEYANGPTTSVWGAIRAKNGHPKPYGLRFMEIGNENGGPAYQERYRMIYEAVHRAHPEIGLVADVWGGVPKSVPVDIVDEHYYSSPDFFFENANRYDRYDRKGPKVYVGEYAVTQGCGGGNLIAAVSEAAFMCGMERNSDHVVMASYAPLFANVNYKKWNPDLINFDSDKVYGTPSYHVQKLFAANRPDRVFESTIEQTPEFGASFPKGTVGVGTWRTSAEYRNLQVVKDGKVVFESKDGSELDRVAGQWENGAGSIKQTSESVEASRAIAKGDFGDSYTFKVSARKIAGDEGFLLNFGYRDADNWLWWNVGGWQNEQNGIELAVGGGKSVIARTQGHIETGRWYELKVEFSPEEIRCHIDGKLVQTAKRPSLNLIHASVGFDDKSHEYVVKLVNGSNRAQTTDVDLQGVAGSLGGTVTTITSTAPTDENSLDAPTKVAPKTAPFSAKGSKFSVDLPACSVSVFRLKARS